MDTTNINHIAALICWSNPSNKNVVLKLKRFEFINLYCYKVLVSARNVSFFVVSTCGRLAIAVLPFLKMSPWTQISLPPINTVLGATAVFCVFFHNKKKDKVKYIYKNLPWNGCCFVSVFTLQNQIFHPIFWRFFLLNKISLHINFSPLIWILKTNHLEMN